jgi:GTPase
MMIHNGKLLRWISKYTWVNIPAKAGRVKHPMYRSGFVSILGRPSAGKSSLLNTLCKAKVAIVSPVPQTTRNKVRGIYTDETGQIVFIDTPGFHRSSKKINRKLMELVTSACDEVDAILYVLDGTRAFGEEEADLAHQIAEQGVPVVVAVNKTDRKDEVRPEVERAVADLLPNARFHRISALSGDGLEPLIQTLMKLMPEGEAMYPSEYYTDQTPEFRMARQELPHSLYVEIADMEQRDASDTTRDPTLWVRAFLVVERESQKGIVVGKNGEKIREIGRLARLEIEELFPYRLYLDLRVKVQPKWRRNDALLDRLISGE